MTDPRTHVGELWWRVNREIHERFRHTFKGLDIPPMTLMMMRHIGMEPGITVSELARRSGTVKSHVSKTIEQLEARGFVEKRPDEQDQRLLRLFPTRAAADMKSQMEARAKAAWAELIADVDDADVVVVLRGFEILLGALDKANRPADKDE